MCNTFFTISEITKNYEDIILYYKLINSKSK